MINFYRIMKLAEKEGISFELAYNNKVFDFIITPTNKRVRRHHVKKDKAIRVYMDYCPFCNKLLVNGVCVYNCDKSQNVDPSKFLERTKKKTSIQS